MELREALAIRPGEVVSIVGAGGKTTLAMRLMAELAAAGPAVIFTTTTKIMEPVLADDERLVLSDRADTVLQLVPEWLSSYRKIFLAAARLAESTPVPADYPFPVRPHKLQGVPPEIVDALAAALPDAVIVNEADGARHRWLKAPADHEPVVPGSTTLLVPVANLAVLGRPLDEASVFRPERVAALSGTAIGQLVTVETVVATLAHPEGGLKGAPPRARVAVVLNTRENGEGARSPTLEARAVAGRLLDRERIERVVIAALRQSEPVREVMTRPRVAAIVLAAGGSRRMGGQPKQLLPVGGQPMLQHVLEAVRAAPVDETVVVLGYRAEEIRDRMQDAGCKTQDARCKIVVNERWEEGLSSSVKVGLDAISPQADAALFVLADQPGLTAGVIAALIDRYRRTGAAIVVPVCRGRRGNPALFDRALFDRLRQAQGDAGGRQLIAELGEAVEEVEIENEGVLIDIDTLEDYERFQMTNDQTALEKLCAIQNLIVDMDGVLYRGDEPLPGVHDFFAFLRERSIGFVLATNNSTRTGQQYVEVMAGMGVSVALSEVLTSAQATAETLSRQTAPGTTVYMIGEDGLREALLEQGFVLTTDGAKYVVVGMDRDLTYEKLRTATLLIRGGAPFMATNPDRTLPTEEGEAPGTGAVLAALEASTGVAPTVVGKPEPTMYQLAMEMMGAAPETTAAVGDRLETDILGGQRAGVTTICVLSGVTAPATLKRSPIQPNLVFDDVAQLAATWRNL